ncbi:MAG TPA: hypothetical protein PK325_11040 [Cyclobacteriaceae bacterium]|nr:carboxypeptidase-like regulatory domain-containing protein [Cyclobacteriaceae bacterium]HMV07304.1 hypothetical protein [Cyclobacteriaceae bacterium]HMV89244.1 hypothetical protein [Cyclobacteriaceae bacterium]HMW99341.1 hypothetical protein [Cyclobacteriaceae bacterium]HMX48870.1 hypothetical protein [Cyclobacteriaceae bacterium]
MGRFSCLVNVRSGFLKIIAFLFLTAGVAGTAFCQRTTRVIVVDSVSFEPLPAVFVLVKNSKKSFLADPSGIFTVQTKPSDTLLLSHVGYYPVVIPLFFEEDAIMVRMRPKVTMLEEAVITARKLYPNELNPRTSKLPETKTVWGTLNQPWEYFNKREKEKRKLVKLMQENDRIKTFMEVVTDPSIKEELMEDYEIGETEYYDILVRFNRQKLPVIYSNDSEKIIDALHNFFEKETQ